MLAKAVGPVFLLKISNLRAKHAGLACHGLRQSIHKGVVSMLSLIIDRAPASASPMRVFARWIELPHDVAFQRPHDAKRMLAVKLPAILLPILIIGRSKFARSTTMPQ
jgi:hypothetical protein